MSLEEALAANTAAIKELTATLAKGKPASTASKADEAIEKEAARATATKASSKETKKITHEDFVQMFKEYITHDDDDITEKRIAKVKEISAEFGVKKASQIAEESWPKAIKMLKALIAAGDEAEGEEEEDNDPLG